MNLTNKLAGIRDSRGIQGIFSRGKNVYHGGIGAAHSGGGPQFGRPSGAGNPRKPPNGNVAPPKQGAQGQPGMNPEMMAIRRRLLRGSSGAIS